MNDDVLNWISICIYKKNKKLVSYMIINGSLVANDIQYITYIICTFVNVYIKIYTHTYMYVYAYIHISNGYNVSKPHPYHPYSTLQRCLRTGNSTTRTSSRRCGRRNLKRAMLGVHTGMIEWYTLYTYYIYISTGMYIYIYSLFRRVYHW